MKKHLNCLAESGRLSGTLSHPERAPAPFKRNSTRLILRLRLAFAKCWRFHRVPAKIRFLKCCLWEQFISAGNKPSEHVCMSVWRESSPFYRVLPQGGQYHLAYCATNLISRQLTATSPLQTGAGTVLFRKSKAAKRGIYSWKLPAVKKHDLSRNPMKTLALSECKP